MGSVAIRDKEFTAVGVTIADTIPGAVNATAITGEDIGAVVCFQRAAAFIPAIADVAFRRNTLPGCGPAIALTIAVTKAAAGTDADAVVVAYVDCLAVAAARQVEKSALTAVTAELHMWRGAVTVIAAACLGGFAAARLVVEVGVLVIPVSIVAKVAVVVTGMEARWAAAGATEDVA
jgi:hypothetical protein